MHVVYIASLLEHLYTLGRLCVGALLVVCLRWHRASCRAGDSNISARIMMQHRLLGVGLSHLFLFVLAKIE